MSEFRCDIPDCGYLAIVPDWQLDAVIAAHAMGHQESMLKRLEASEQLAAKNVPGLTGPVLPMCTCLRTASDPPIFAAYDPFCVIHERESVR